jgi:hypothetical protein
VNGQSISDFKVLVSNLLKARFPYLYISTWEEERAVDVIRSVVTDESLIKTTRKVLGHGDGSPGNYI